METSGVQELIDKLKNQGVGEGQKQGNEIIQDAGKQAAQIISQAQKEADKMLSDGRNQLEVERKSSHAAIKTAFRDTELALRSKVREAFSAHLKRLVSLELEDKEFLKQLVLAAAGSIPEGSLAEVLLSSKMDHLVLGITEGMLREGIELKTSPDVIRGIKVRLTGKDIELDLTDEALSDLLLKHLLPKYKEIVTGQK